MATQYATRAQFDAAMTAAQVRDLLNADASPYLVSASSYIDELCGKTFALTAGIVEVLYKAGGAFGGDAAIDQAGSLWLYPRRAYPLSDPPTSITWIDRTPASSTTQTVPASTTVVLVNVDTLKDEHGDGYAYVVRESFAAYRASTRTLKVTVTYTGGYTTYPDWLIRGCIQAAAVLLKRRGAQAMEMTDSGMIALRDDDRRDLRAAVMPWLGKHVRKF